MMDFGLNIANFIFYVFHTGLILFNLLGWLHPKLRKLNLFSLLVTFGSWFLLGLWKGWGYCFLTDWHYQVLRSLGERDMPSSYIAFLVEKLTGWLPEAKLVDALTIGLAVLALLCSLWVNFKRSK
ncbi:DUF2784 family protein [Gelidibacter gilvus]|uniref:DUF2784 family protein n=2 Tax=Gelidibacter gilvus TaxID=59602 RepID=A0A4Q0XFD2_9FLAO|nr:DUF2784 family protein [Gelidibacter gilvus]